MAKLIGRTKEMEKLQALLDSDEAELLAIYGRRRVGKTHLISQFFGDKGIYFELTGVANGKMSDQLRRFPEACYEAFPTETRIEPPKNWTEAFTLLWQRIKEEPKNKKIILFFDELPWLATPRSDMLMSLEHAWNRYFSRRGNLVMVLCGSAASWMIKKIVNNKNGLYGRLTEKMHLQPFSLLETEQFLQSENIHLERCALVEVYMATGGIPKYLSHIQKGGSSAQIIQALCFSDNGFLSTEFRSLFEALFDNYDNHVAVIRALSKTRQGLTYKEIVKLSKVSSGGQLTKCLDELEASGFIGVTFAYKKKNNEKRYRIIDEYTLFYLTWIEDALFQKKKPITDQYWQSMHLSPKFVSWAGYAFENICHKHIDRIIDGLKLSVVARGVSSWQHRPPKNAETPGAQIDLVIERADRSISLCEIKFHNGEYVVTKDYAKALNRKRSIFQSVTKERKTLFNVLITPHGAVENSAYHSAVDSQLNLSALFLS